MVPIDTGLESIKANQNIVVVDPAINAFVSMVLVVNDENEPGIHEWVSKTYAKLSTEERFRHKLVTNGFYFSLIPLTNAGNFQSFIDQLEATPPLEYRHNLLSGYDNVFEMYREEYPEMKKPDWDVALISAANYVNQLKSIFGEERTDVDIETRAYQYVIDPSALKELIVGHIRWFWDEHLKPEWERVKPLLDESARAFSNLNLSRMSREELVRFITGKEKNDSKWSGLINSVSEVYFLPNAHIGPYIRTAFVRDAAYVVFGAHLPEGSNIHIPELDRAEIVSKLSALADETRLTILQLLGARGEMRSTEIMDEIKLSQPSTSRYLAQLTANGYLNEKRINSAKVYSLNLERIQKTLQAVEAFLLSNTK